MNFSGYLLRASLVFALALVTFSQTREKRVKPVDSGQAESFSKADTVGVAVLVGVGKYPRYSGLSELHYPAVDVDTLAATLKKQRYLVLTLKDSDATKESVLNAISQAGEALAGENMTAIFFFSGHGFAVNGDNYLAALDASVNKLAATGLSVKAVEQALTKTQASRRVMWIDACRDEAGKGVESRTFANLQASAGTRLLLSTKAGKVSYEDEELKQGIFSYYLVKGLQGDAAGPDGLVTFQDLSSYVTLRVRARSLEAGHVQVPYEAGEATGDFLIARTASGSATETSTAPSVAATRVVVPPPAVINNGPRQFETKVNPKDGQTYVYIPAGSFYMGCSPGDSECEKNEKPSHNVPITKGFWLGQTAVTQAAWRRVMSSDPSHFKGDNLPVEMVSWDESKRYCEAIGGRLPTEAEWEYAARAGTAGPRYGDLDSIAWYSGNSGNRTHAVGIRQPNEWKLYDMLGNVWQWTSDWYSETYYSQGSSGDPQGPSYGEGRTLRGGSWNYFPRVVRASGRDWFAPGNRFNYVGFRCVGE